MPAQKRIHAYFLGTVQGIGFRFTAERLADDLGLTGWVKNLRDGRVEVVAEGGEEALKEFIAKMNKRMGGYIRDFVIDWQEARGEFRNFDVAFT